MTIPVLIGPLEGSGFRATGGEPFSLSAEGATRDGALTRLRELIEARMAAGAEIVTLELAAPDHPWPPWRGGWRTAHSSANGEKRWRIIAVPLKRTTASDEPVRPRY